MTDFEQEFIEGMLWTVRWTWFALGCIVSTIAHFALLYFGIIKY